MADRIAEIVVIDPKNKLQSSTAYFPVTLI